MAETRTSLRTCGKPLPAGRVHKIDLVPDVKPGRSSHAQGFEQGLYGAVLGLVPRIGGIRDMQQEAGVLQALPVWRGKRRRGAEAASE